MKAVPKCHQCATPACVLCPFVYYFVSCVQRICSGEQLAAVCACVHGLAASFLLWQQKPRRLYYSAVVCRPRVASWGGSLCCRVVICVAVWLLQHTADHICIPLLCRVGAWCGICRRKLCSTQCLFVALLCQVCSVDSAPSAAGFDGTLIAKWM